MNTTYGQLADNVAFNDYRIPAWVWKKLSVCTDTGCWEWTARRPDGFPPKVVMAMRLLDVPRGQIFAVTQNCANSRCANPKHLYVVLTRK